MTKEEIFATVKEIAAEELDIDEAKIVPDAKIKEDLEADSLDVFEIMNELEDKFDIELDVEDGAETINDVVELVAKRLAVRKTKMRLGILFSGQGHKNKEWAVTCWLMRRFQRRWSRPVRRLNLISSSF